MLATHLFCVLTTGLVCPNVVAGPRRPETTTVPSVPEWPDLPNVVKPLHHDWHYRNNPNYKRYWDTHYWAAHYNKSFPLLDRLPPWLRANVTGTPYVEPEVTEAPRNNTQIKYVGFKPPPWFNTTGMNQSDFDKMPMDKLWGKNFTNFDPVTKTLRTTSRPWRTVFVPESRPFHIGSTLVKHENIPHLHDVMSYKPPKDDFVAGRHDAEGLLGKVELGTVDDIPTLVWTPPTDPCLESAREAFQKVGLKWIKLDAKALFAPNSSVEPISSSTVPPLDLPVDDIEYDTDVRICKYNRTLRSRRTAQSTENDKDIVCDMHGLIPRPRRTTRPTVPESDLMGPDPINQSETGGPEVEAQVVTPDPDIFEMLRQLSHFQDSRAANKSDHNLHCRSTLSSYMIGVYLLLGIMALLVSSSIFSLSISRCVESIRKKRQELIQLDSSNYGDTYQRFQDPSRLSVCTENGLKNYPPSVFTQDSGFSEPTSVFINFAGRFFCLNGKQVAVVEDPSILYDIMESFSQSPTMPTVFHMKLKQAIREHELLLTEDPALDFSLPSNLPKWDGVIPLAETPSLSDIQRDISNLHDYYAKLRDISPSNPPNKTELSIISETNPKKVYVRKTIQALSLILEPGPVFNSKSADGVDAPPKYCVAHAITKANRLFLAGRYELELEFNGWGKYRFDPYTHGYEIDTVPEGRHILVSVNTPLGILPDSPKLPAAPIIHRFAIFVPNNDKLEPTLQILE